MKYSEISIGMKDSLSKTFTDADIVMFAGVSLDVNPLHMSDEFAKTTVFGKRICHGMLSCGLISACLANKLPGAGTIYLGQEVKFTAPVFIGDTVTAVLEIVDMRDDKHIIKLSTNCFKQDGTQVIAGTATIKLP